MVVAQVSYRNGLSYQGGMFGDRTLGQSLSPRPSTFGGQIQTAPSGAFLYIGNQGTAGGFATPWRQIDPLVVLESVSPPPGGRPLPIVEVTPPLVSPATTVLPPEYLPPEVFAAEQPATASPTETGTRNNAGGANNPGGTNNTAPTGQATNAAPTGQTPAASPGNAPRTTAIVALSAEASPAASASPAPTASFVRSARLSERLTRIARGQNLLAGQDINVYLSNHVALLQGTVRAVGDRVLLANIVNLEPSVWQINNRLTVERPAATGFGTDPSRPTSPQ
jgi:hypothetical protein